MLYVALSIFSLGEAQDKAPITTGSALLAPRLQRILDSRRRQSSGQTEYALGAAGTPDCDSGSWNNVYCGAAEYENSCDAFPGFQRITKGATKAECEAAQTWLEANGATTGTTGVTDMYDGLLPGGCIFGKQSWYPESDAPSFHWNSQTHGGQGREQWGGSSARSDPNWQPICAKTAAPPSADGFEYTAGHIGVYGGGPELVDACPTGYSRMDEVSTDKAACDSALSWLQANDNTVYLSNVNAPSYSVISTQESAYEMSLGGVHGLPGGCIFAGGDVYYNSETSGVSHSTKRPICRKAVTVEPTCEEKLELIRAILA